MISLRLDPWSPEYGADVEMPLHGEGAVSGAQVDPAVEQSRWTDPIVPGRAAAEGTSRTLFFVDGVRRVDVRLMADDGERRAWGLAGSYAVGAVRSDAGGARLETARVERILALGGGLDAPALAVRVGAARLVYRPVAVPGDDPEGPLDHLQGEMRRAEATLAGELSERGIVLADGPLTYVLAEAAPVVGVVKRMILPYLGPAEAALLPRLEPGARTPIFAFGNQALDRFAWYMRLVTLRRGWHDLAGIVRCEVRISLGLGSTRALADRLALLLPGFAGRPGLDPRAPQNMAPVGALEADLRRRLGHPDLVRRALAAAMSEPQPSEVA